ncbi:hypothetical protein [Sphingomonas sp. CLY1604]|uniref:hypothetical protein n=1 Tax=Sphingomonas sp. CLY1604 TaxID=3457786 RepID=UPI003FD6D730
MQNDIVATPAPVFNINPPHVDPVERRAEIDLVIELATAAIPKAQMRKLGRLSYAPARDDDDFSYFAEIRSEPIGASGLEFRFPMPASEMGRNDPVDIAAEVADGAVQIALGASRLRKVVGIVREIADDALRPAVGGIAEARIVAIGMTPDRAGGDAKVTVDVEMLGDDLTMNVERACEFVEHGGLDRLEQRLQEFAAKHIARRALLARAKVSGTPGWIDDSASRILDHAGFDRGQAFGMLRSDRQVDFTFRGKNGHDTMGSVYWDDGVVRGYVEDCSRGRAFRLEAKVLTIKCSCLPATIAASLVGRSLGELIEIDYIPGNALIIEAEELGDRLQLRLEIGETSIKEAIGS